MKANLQLGIGFSFKLLNKAKVFCAVHVVVMKTFSFIKRYIQRYVEVSVVASFQTCKPSMISSHCLVRN